MKLLLSAALVLLAGALPTPVKEGTPRPPSAAEASVLSYDTIDPADFNATVEAARVAGSDWVQDPYQVMLHLLRLWPEPPARLDLSMTGGAGEAAKEMVATAFVEGLHDDSIDGLWVRARLAQRSGGAWVVVEQQRAYRCARSADVHSFHRERCP